MFVLNTLNTSTQGNRDSGGACNWRITGLNPSSVLLGRCVLGQEFSPVLTTGGGQMALWP